MAGAAAFAAGTAYRKRSSLAFILGSTTRDEVNALHATEKKLDAKMAKQLLPSFYDPAKAGSNNDHAKVSLQASSSSVSSFNNRNGISFAVENSVITQPELSYSESLYQPANSSPYDSVHERDRWAKCEAKKRAKSARLRRRQSSWKEPGPLTRAIPYLSPIFVAYLCCFINFILPGFGTLIAGTVAGLRSNSARCEFSPKRAFLWNLLAATLQFVFAPIVFGWIYSVLWGLEAVNRARLLHLSKQNEIGGDDEEQGDKYEQGDEQGEKGSQDARAGQDDELSSCDKMQNHHHHHHHHHHSQQGEDAETIQMTEINKSSPCDDDKLAMSLPVDNDSTAVLASNENNKRTTVLIAAQTDSENHHHRKPSIIVTSPSLQANEGSLENLAENLHPEKPEKVDTTMDQEKTAEKPLTENFP